MPNVNHITLAAGAYLAGEQAIPAGVTTMEVWGVDATPWTADVQAVVRFTDQAGVAVERNIPAGQTYATSFPGRGGSTDTYNIATPAGIAVGSVKFT